MIDKEVTIGHSIDLQPILEFNKVNFITLYQKLHAKGVSLCRTAFETLSYRNWANSKHLNRRFIAIDAPEQLKRSSKGAI